MLQPYNRAHSVPQLYIDVNELEDQGRFNILEPEDPNSEGFVFFL